MAQAQRLDPIKPLLFDAEAALQRCFDNSEMLADMVRFFLTEADGSITQINTALREGDLKAVADLGHRLKGTLVYLAAEPATKTAERLEQLDCPGTSAADAEQAVDALNRQCAALKSVLSRHPLTIGPGLPEQA
jgi:HPt (histidine-containing phosphotransfer) domain-containing protein